MRNRVPRGLEDRVLELAGLAPVAPPPDDATEKGFQADVVKLARRLGWLCYHTHDSRKSTAGFPDLVLARAPVLMAAELKVGDNTTTPEQDDWLAAFRAAGIRAEVWYPADWPRIERTLRRTECRP